MDPDRKTFQHLQYAPFVVELGELFHKWGDLRLEGYIQGKQVIVKKYSGKGIDQKFTLLPDDTSLIADGADTTRVVLRVTDEFDAIRPFANDAIKFELEGPAEIIGDNPFCRGGRNRSDLDSSQRAGRNRAADGDASGAGQAAGGVSRFPLLLRKRCSISRQILRPSVR